MESVTQPQEIKNWIESGQEYFSGLILLHKYSKNRHLILILTRKPNPGKLLYELKRLLPKSVIIEYLNQPEKKTESTVPGKDGTDRLRIVRNNKTIPFDDLPPRLQKVYTDTVNAYKHMRALHERAKIIIDDQLRKPVVEQIVKMDDQIRTNWATIDSWDGQPDVPGGTIDHKRINANRKFITDNRQKYGQMSPGPAKDELKLKMQSRIDELLAAGEIFQKIKAVLTNLGFALK